MFGRVGGCCGCWIRGFGLENFCLGGLGLWIFVGEVVGVLFFCVCGWGCVGGPAGIFGVVLSNPGPTGVSVGL